MITLYFVAYFINIFLCIPYLTCPSSGEQFANESIKPLLLSNYLINNDTETARTLSRVDMRKWSSNIASHSGYINVDKNHNSNLWFWYFPVKNYAVEKSPFVIWLQGGPAATSLFGLFEEMGPFKIEENSNELKENPYSWHNENSLLFIDNPVGTGFSFSNSEEGYAQNQTIIAEHLYTFLIQFLRIFPELQNVPLYITGESYAGKHVPSFAYIIHKKNPTAELKVNLKGVAIGNGLIDPESTINYSKYLYQLGLIDDNQMAKLRRLENLTKTALEEKNYKNAFHFDTLILGAFMEMSGIRNYYNYMSESGAQTGGPFVKFVEQPDVKKALHTINKEFLSIDIDVYKKLIPDFMKSVKYMVEVLLEHYRVMLYSGQLDIIDAYPMAIKAYRSFNWSGSNDYLNAKRKPWYVDEVIIGYTKKARNLFEVLVRNAGHLLAKDQPKRAELLINSFIKDLPFDKSNYNYSSYDESYWYDPPDDS
ncbi:venom serine carboxypeptidase-like [Arctopsyche grandis]|uniref:venom serine carboxypeptidase-like n=1 Tax=Arctopsyche grandis TaxID=121162 RepID=UPI00406D9E9E